MKNFVVVFLRKTEQIKCFSSISLQSENINEKERKRKEKIKKKKSMSPEFKTLIREKETKESSNRFYCSCWFPVVFPGED